MPLIEDTNEQYAYARSIGQPDWTPEAVPFKELLRASYRMDNSIGSYFARNPDLPDSEVNNESFNPWDHLTDDEKLNEKFVSHAALADTADELNAVRSQMDRENRDRQTIADGGMMGYVTGAIVGVADPINLIPVGGTAYQTYRTGGSILKGAAATASVAAGSQAMVEAALHHTQLTRTYGESGANIAGAAILGGALGGGVAALQARRNRHLLDQVDRSLDPEPRLAAGQNSILDHGSVGAARVDNDIQVSGKFARALTKALGFDPLSQTITSTRKETRILAAQMAENPIAMETKTGESYVPDSVESRAKIKDGLYIKALQGHLSAFSEYRKAGGKLKRKAFNEAVSKEMRNPAAEPVLSRDAVADDAGNVVETDPNALPLETPTQDPHIAKAAKAWRTELYDPLKKEVIDLKLLPEDVSVNTAVNYLNRMYNKGAITANLDRWVEVVGGWLKEQTVEKLRIQGEITGRLEGIKGRLAEQEELSSRLEKAKEGGDSAKNLKKELDVITTKINDDLEFLEKNIADFPGKTGDSVRAAIKNRKADSPQSLTKALTKAAKSIEARDDLEYLDYASLAREIATRIDGTTGGMLPYDYKIGENSSSAPGPSVAGPLSKRSFVIPDKLIEEFLQNDVEVLGGRYLQALAMDIELTRKFGDVEMIDELKAVSAAWSKEIQKASKTDPKLALKLGKKKLKDIQNIEAMRDRLRGKYGAGDPDNLWSRIWRGARDLNYLRLMGGVVASSIPDVARIVMAEGLASTFGKGLNELVGNTKAFKVSAQEGKEWGIGAEALMGGRSQILADVADFQQGGNALERGLRAASANFGKINMMDRWTSGVKQLHYVVAQTKMADMMTAGKYDKRWANIGIDEYDSSLMAEQLRRYGKKDGKTWIANTKEWDDQNLARLWGTALRNESDRVIIMPGQEKPLFMSRELGKTIMQFRTFMFSATQRVLIAGIQGQDRHIVQGVLGLTSLGMMAYAFKQWDAGREISDDPMVWLTEGIDRSGMLGILMEANNTLEKMSKNSLGMRPLLGIDVPASRFASRSQSEAFLGPTFGSLLESTLKVAGGSLEGDMDARAIRRLLPYQNLLLFRQGLDKIEESIR